MAVDIQRSTIEVCRGRNSCRLSGPLDTLRFVLVLVSSTVGGGEDEILNDNPVTMEEPNAIWDPVDILQEYLHTRHSTAQNV